LKFLLFLLLIVSISNAKVDYKEYCKNNTLRETHIIIDLNNIDKLLYGKVIKELIYLPHEKVNLYYFKNKNLVKNYTFCNPQFNNYEIKKINNKPLLQKAFGTEINKMSDDQMFLKKKLTSRLVNMQKAITNSKNSNFLNAFSSIENDIKKQSRIILFTNNKFSENNIKFDLKYANIEIYRKNLPEKNIITKSETFFLNNNAYLKSFYTRMKNKNKNSNLNTAKAKFNIYINNKSRKAEIFININNRGVIINGWINIYGILQVPLNGTASIKNGKILTLKAKIPKRFKYKNNVAYKDDCIELRKDNKHYIGKYYNYNYSFDQLKFKYFEYRIK